MSATDAAARAVALGFARNASPIVPVAAAWRTGGDKGRELAGNGWNRLIPDLKTAFAAASLGTLVGPREQDLLLIVHAPVVEASSTVTASRRPSGASWPDTASGSSTSRWPSGARTRAGLRWDGAGVGGADRKSVV